MRRPILLIGFLLLSACLLLAQATNSSTIPNGTASQPAVPAPMAPIAVWAPATPTAPTAAATTPPQPEVNTSVRELGAGSFSGLSSVWGASDSQQSLADASREAREKMAKDHPHVFTNDDVSRLRLAAGEPPLGVAPAGRPVTNEETMPASDVTTPPASDPTMPPAGGKSSKPSPFRQKQP